MGLTWCTQPGRRVADTSLRRSTMVCILTLFRIDKTEGSENVNLAASGLIFS